MRGKVLFWKSVRDADGKFDVGSFGFITPDGSSGRREDNLWFGPKSLKPVKGYTPKSGDYLDFDEGNYKKDKGRQVERVLAVIEYAERGEIETIGGLDDVA
jgi:hypothetical protein